MKPPIITKDRRGLAIVSMLIFTIVFTILSGVLLGVISNSTRDLESHIRGAKGYYISEAASVLVIDALRRNQAAPSSVDVDWFYDDAGNLQDVKTATVSIQAGAGPAGTDILSTTTEFASSI